METRKGIGSSLIGYFGIRPLWRSISKHFETFADSAHSSYYNSINRKSVFKIEKTLTALRSTMIVDRFDELVILQMQRRVRPDIESMRDKCAATSA